MTTSPPELDNTDGCCYCGSMSSDAYWAQTGDGPEGVLCEDCLVYADIESDVWIWVGDGCGWSPLTDDELAEIMDELIARYDEEDEDEEYDPLEEPEDIAPHRPKGSIYDDFDEDDWSLYDQFMSNTTMKQEPTKVTSTTTIPKKDSDLIGYHTLGIEIIPPLFHTIHGLIPTPHGILNHAPKTVFPENFEGGSE